MFCWVEGRSLRNHIHQTLLPSRPLFAQYPQAPNDIYINIYILYWNSHFEPFDFIIRQRSNSSLQDRGSREHHRHWNHLSFCLQSCSTLGLLPSTTIIWTFPITCTTQLSKSAPERYSWHFLQHSTSPTQLFLDFLFQNLCSLVAMEMLKKHADEFYLLLQNKIN